MSRLRDSADAALPLEVTRQIDALCDEFERALNRGAGASLDDCLGRVDPRGRERLLEELTLLALDRLQKSAAPDARPEPLAANPTANHDSEISLAAADPAATVAASDRQRSAGKASGLVVRCPHCRSAIDMVVDASLMEIACPQCGGTFSLINDADNTRAAPAVTHVAHFELVERLGMGEFGAVWKARDTILDRTVALKIPRREHLDPVTVEKFMREARAAAQLCHPNIVSTYEVGRDGDTLYIVSECIHGASLAETAADHRLGIRESVTLVAKVADALDHAHRAGVIHRDLKPSNILIDDVGEPHLTDFGLAKRNEREMTITTEGAILGTPAYMSPEQARGEAHRVDGRCDVYSLGVILFQLLTGELPFRGSTRMLLQKVIHDDPPGPRTLDGRIPKDLDTICLKCLEKEPARRYAAAGDLAADLSRYLAGQPVAARRLGKIGRTLRWSRRNPAVALLLAATLVTLMTATAVSTYFGWRAADYANRVTDTYYNSLQQEIRLTSEVRTQGYGETVRQLVDQARNLPSTRVDNEELRRQLVRAMGDFAAYRPVAISPGKGDVTCLQLGNDGAEAFVGLTVKENVGLNKGLLQIYDARTGELRDELAAFEGLVMAIALVGDDQLLAADDFGVAKTWRREGRQWTLERTLRMSAEPYAVVFSPDGQRVVWLKKSVLEVWDVASGAKLRTLPTKPDWIMRNAAFDMPHNRLVGGYMNEELDTVGLALWNLETDELPRNKELPSLGSTYSYGLDVSPDGDRLTIGFDESLLIYDLEHFEQTTLFAVDSTKAVAFSSLSPYLAAANIRGRITVWNSVTNRPLATLQLPRQRKSRDDLAFSADGLRLAASNADSIQIWDLSKGNERTRLEGHQGGIPCAAFHPDGRTLATGGKDRRVRTWNPSTGRGNEQITLNEAVQALAYSPDGQLLAIGCLGRRGAPHLRLVDASSNAILYEATPAMGLVNSTALASGPAGTLLAACGEHGVALWKVSQEKPLRLDTVFELPRETCLATILSPDGRWMIWTQDDRNLHAWDVVNGREKELRAPPMLQGWHGLSFLPDGESFIFVSTTGTAEVWNVADDRRVDSLGAAGTFKAPHIALSPNGKWLAALTELDTVSVWDMPSKRHVFSLRPEAASVWSLAWDQASEQLAVGQSDGGLAIWHLPRIRQALAESRLPWREDP